MHTEDIEYHADGARLVGQYVVDDGKPGKRPGVLVCHEGPGLTEHTKKRFFYHEATDRRSWNAMIELFNETLK
jgi:hypothetical protein